MKRKELLDALNKAKSGLATNKVVPIFSYFLFKDNEIRSFNGYEGVITKFTHTLDCCIDGDILLKLINSYTTDEIDIVVNNNLAVITAGKSEVKLPTLESKDFIFTEKPESETILHQFSLTDNFIKGLDTLIDIASKDKIQENKNGITVATNKKSLTLFATNGKTVAKYDTDITVDTDLNVFLPVGLCEKFISYYNDNKKIGTLVIDNLKIKGDFTNTFIISMKKDIELLDFINKVFNKYELSKVTMVPKGELDLVIKRSEIFFESIQGKQVIFDCNGKTIVFTAKSDNSIFKEELDIPLTASKFNILLSELGTIMPKIIEIGYCQGEKSLFIGRDTNYLTITGI